MIDPKNFHKLELRVVDHAFLLKILSFLSVLALLGVVVEIGINNHFKEKVRELTRRVEVLENYPSPVVIRGIETTDPNRAVNLTKDYGFDPDVAEREDFFCSSVAFRACMKSDECLDRDVQSKCTARIWHGFNCDIRDNWCVGSEKYDEYAAGDCLNSIRASTCEDWDRRLLGTSECAKVCTKPDGMRAWWNAPVFQEELR